jgi:hypothetical protein
MRVAILGCGPAGLIAAYAAEVAGHIPTIYSHKVQSKIFGAQYLHEPIPGLSPDEPELEIQVIKMGSARGYAKNVYNDLKMQVSWNKFKEGFTPGWSLKRVYDQLWARYEDRIHDIIINPSAIKMIVSGYDKTFSTFPARSICSIWQHNFPAAAIWVIHGPVEKDAVNREQNIMIYNGVDMNGASGWYRYSCISGYESWEFSSRHTQLQILDDGLQISEGFKPLGTNCDCHPNLIRLGRFGKWDKNVFTHHSYQEVLDALH